MAWDIARLLLPLVSSLLVGAAFWVDQLWALIFIAFLPIFFAMDQACSRFRALGPAFLFVFPAALILGYPLLSLRSVQSIIPIGSQFYIIIGFLLGYLFFLASLAALALWGPFIFFKARFLRILFVPAVWILFEIIKAKLSFGLQWIFVGEPLIEFLPLGIFARLGGIYVLSFLVMGLNVSFYEGLKFFFASRPSRRALALLLGTFLCAAVITAAGWWYASVSQSVFYPEARKGEFKIAVIQPGSSAGWEKRGDFFDDLHRRTRETARPEDIAGVDLLILPGDYFRSVSRSDLETKNLAADTLGFPPDVSAVLLGSALLEEGKRYQALVLQSRSKSPQLTFKEVLLPFSDFIPGFIKSIYPASADLSGKYSMRRNRTLELPGGIRVGTLTCNETLVSWLAARLRNEGARFLIVSGSIDDFASEIAYRESLRASRFRALENGVFVVQAMKNGISAIIDPYGRVLQSLGKDERGILVGEIPL